jgi:hypothetical protein
MKKALGYLPALMLLAASCAVAQDAKGSLTANGQTTQLKHAVAFEADSTAEPGYMDIVVVVSDRKLPEAVFRSREHLEEMTTKEGLVALRVVLNPDAKLMSAAPMHPAFKTFLGSALWAKWKPGAYDEKKVAGRFYTEGMQNEFGQKWQYDVTFSAPIRLDPTAKTVPK